jgi:hypothetical protein
MPPHDAPPRGAAAAPRRCLSWLEACSRAPCRRSCSRVTLAPAVHANPADYLADVNRFRPKVARTQVGMSSTSGARKSALCQKHDLGQKRKCREGDCHKISWAASHPKEAAEKRAKRQRRQQKAAIDRPQVERPEKHFCSWSTAAQQTIEESFESSAADVAAELTAAAGVPAASSHGDDSEGETDEDSESEAEAAAAAAQGAPGPLAAPPAAVAAPPAAAAAPPPAGPTATPPAAPRAATRTALRPAWPSACLPRLSCALSAAVSRSLSAASWLSPRAARVLPLRRSASRPPNLPARALPPPPGSRDASAAAPSGLAVEGPRWSAMTVDRRGPSFASGLSPPCGSIGSRRLFLACARRGGRLSDFNLDGILVGGFDETACVGVRAAPPCHPMGPHASPRQRVRRLAPSHSALACRPPWQHTASAASAERDSAAAAHATPVDGSAVRVPCAVLTAGRDACAAQAPQAPHDDDPGRQAQRARRPRARDRERARECFFAVMCVCA